MLGWERAGTHWQGGDERAEDQFDHPGLRRERIPRERSVHGSAQRWEQGRDGPGIAVDPAGEGKRELVAAAVGGQIVAVAAGG